MGSLTVPLLPCRDVDEILDFYQALGFSRTYRQLRPNPYVVVQRDDIELHFAAIRGFDPKDSYGSCLIFVDDTWALYREFAEGLRRVYGKLPVSDIPRMTRPRKRKNSGERAGFTVIDPGGNWIRLFPFGEDAERERDPAGKLGSTLENAVVFGEAKGDATQAARILDGALLREQHSATIRELVEARVYRAELAMRLDDAARAAELLAQVRVMDLDGDTRAVVVDALENARELEDMLPGQAIS